MLLPEHGLLRDVHLRGSERSGGVALTFDDGPNGICTLDVLDALRETGAPATFFVLGANVARDGADLVLARMVREGHTIGLHGWDHGVRHLFWSDLLADDLTRSVAAVSDALAHQGLPPPPIHAFRPPYGFLIGPAVRGARALGLVVVEWTVSVQDWRPACSADDVVAELLSMVQPGDVILLHDGNRDEHASAERCVDRAQAGPVVRQLVPALAARGLRVLPLDDLLGLVPPDSRRTQVDSTSVTP